MKSSQFHLEVLLSFLLLTLGSFINATPISAPLEATYEPPQQGITVWGVTYTWLYSSNGGYISNPVQVCQGTSNPNPWIATPGKSICTWTFLWQPDWGRKCNMYLFDQNCTLIGKNLRQVTLDELADPKGWGFSSELPDFVVINIPPNPNTTVTNQNLTFWYDGEMYSPWDHIPTNYDWLINYGFSWVGTAGIFTVIRYAFAC